VGLTPTPSLASATLPRVWQGLGYRPLPEATAARALFDFAAVPWPTPDMIAFTWGAFTGTDRLVGALAAESDERSMMFHGPVIVTEDEPLEVAAQLVAAALDTPPHSAPRPSSPVRWVSIACGSVSASSRFPRARCRVDSPVGRAPASTPGVAAPRSGRYASQRARNVAMRVTALAGVPAPPSSSAASPTSCRPRI